LLVLVSVAGATGTDAQVGHTEYVYAGTWNNIEPDAKLGFARGVYGWRLDTRTGDVQPIGVVAETVLSADTLVASPDRRTLYVTEYDGCLCTRSWPFPGAPPAQVGAWRIDAASGKLALLNRVETLGEMPADIRPDATGRTLAIANYYGGNVVTYKVHADGSLGDLVSNVHHQGKSVHASAGPHPHGVAFSPDNRWLYVADQGLDRLYTYQFDPDTSAITPAKVPFLQFDAGIGPRTVAIHPTPRWLYVSTEQGGNVLVVERAGDGTLQVIQSLPIIPEGSKMLLGAAQTRLSPDARFLYVNHRPNENVAVFSVDPQTGKLALVEFADSSARSVTAKSTPEPAVPWERKTLWQKVETGARAFAWDSSATWVASASLGENALALLRRDARTGDLTSAGKALPVPQPSYVLIVRPQ
jgi:6-phosphogluconolactonase